MAFFGYFLSPRKESNPPEAKGKRAKERKILHGRTAPSASTHVYRKPMRYLSGRMWASAPTHVYRRQNISNQRPKAATYLCRFAAKARFDNRPTPVGVSKEGGTHRPKAVEKEDSVKETHQGFLSRSVRKPIFALQKS